METLSTNNYTEAFTSQDKMSSTLTTLKNPTQESVAVAFGLNQSEDVNKLVPFTGYYSLDNSQGGFISIDTTEIILTLFNNPAWIFPTVTISISTNGTSATQYKFDDSCSFDGTTLTIPSAKLTIAFNRNYNNGILTTFTGTLGTQNITGQTRFNPVPLSTFVGNYILGGTTVLSIPTTLAMQFNFENKGLTDVNLYFYVPSMFVLLFADPNDSTNKCELMLGTAGNMGLACSISSTLVNGMALTIPTSA